MTPRAERRLLQCAVAAASVVPLAAGAAGVLTGAGFLDAGGLTDLDSHVRYLSGLLLGIGVAFASSVTGIERRGPRMRLLGGLVIAGGLARLASLVADGAPGAGHRFGLVMELGVVPALLLWQARVARRCAAATGAT